MVTAWLAGADDLLSAFRLGVVCQSPCVESCRECFSNLLVGALWWAYLSAQRGICGVKTRTYLGGEAVGAEALDLEAAGAVSDEAASTLNSTNVGRGEDDAEALLLHRGESCEINLLVGHLDRVC